MGSIFYNFALLGVTAFGGPAVHFSMYIARLVDSDMEKRWISLTRYNELFAMCGCLPGPSSTQCAFAIGITQQGTLGGLLAGFSFLIPGFIGMTILGLVSHSLQDEIANTHSVASGVAAACSAVGVGLVFKAVVDLTKKTATGGVAGTICVLSASSCLLFNPSPAWLNPVLILAGGLVTVLIPSESKASETIPPAGRSGLPVWAGCLIFLLYIVVGGCTIYLDSLDVVQLGKLGWLPPFLTAGMFVWGGGPVVLPMLMHPLAPRFIDKTIFLTGIALAEMMPGPVFNMACFLGVQLSLNHGFNWLLGTFLAWLCLVGPGVTLTFGAMPLWNKLRDFRCYKKALPGLNSAAVGLLVSTLFVVYEALEEKSPYIPGSRAVALCTYAAVEKFGPQCAVHIVLVAAALGAAWSFTPLENP